MIVGLILSIILIMYLKIYNYNTKKRYFISKIFQLLLIGVIIYWSLSSLGNVNLTYQTNNSPLNIIKLLFFDFKMIVIGCLIPFCFAKQLNFFGFFEMLQAFNYQDIRKDERINKTNKNKNMENEKIYMQQAKELKDTKDKIALGINLDDGTPLYMKRNFYNCVHTASARAGKTETMYNVVDFAIREQIATTIIDAKADVGKGSLYEKIATRKYSKSIIFDFSNKIKNDEWYYNPFLNYGAIEITDMLISMSDFSEEHYKANFKNYAYKIIKILQKTNLDINFYSVVKYLNIHTFTDYINDLEDKFLSDELLQDIKNLGMSQKGLYNALDAVPRYEQLIYDEYIGLFTNDTNNKKPVNNLYCMDNKYLILHLIDSLSLPDTAQMLGRLLVAEQRTAINRTTNSDTKYLIADESNVYIGYDFGFILDKGLGKGHHTYLSTQSVADYKMIGEELRDKIFENCRNIICQIQTTNESADYMAGIFGTKEVYETTSQVDKDEGSSEKGTMKLVNEYRVKPDSIKSFKTGHGAFLQKEDNKEVLAVDCYFKFRKEEKKAVSI